MNWFWNWQLLPARSLRDQKVSGQLASNKNQTLSYQPKLPPLVGLRRLIDLAAWPHCEDLYQLSKRKIRLLKLTWLESKSDSSRVGSFHGPWLKYPEAFILTNASKDWFSLNIWGGFIRGFVKLLYAFYQSICNLRTEKYSDQKKINSRKTGKENISSKMKLRLKAF